MSFGMGLLVTRADMESNIAGNNDKFMDTNLLDMLQIDRI